MVSRSHHLLAHFAALTVAITALTTACSSSVGGPPPKPTTTTQQALPSSGTADCDSLTTCYTPHQIDVAYGVQPLLRRGIDGRGETVVLPELAESQLAYPQVSDLRDDFTAFDHLFHLPAPSLRVVSTFSGPQNKWLANGEEVGDAEMVHAIAPRAALTVVLVKETSLNSAAQAVAASIAALRLGASEGGIISLSPAGQIGGEHCVDHAQVIRLNSALQYDADRHVTVVAATGDAGAAGEPCALITALTGGISSGFTPRKEPILVASDPLVLSVGGTTLHASRTTGAWMGETTWGLPFGTQNTGFQASGGGYSHIFRRPSYQNHVPGIGAMRGVPDVSASANPHVSMAGAFGNGSRPLITNEGGTSASAPFWAGIIALADQYAKRHLGLVNPAIYRIARTPKYHQAFHDITTGPRNTVTFPNGTIDGYPAGPGWDPVTGWGSPNANMLVPFLASPASH